MVTREFIILTTLCSFYEEWIYI